MPRRSRFAPLPDLPRKRVSAVENPLPWLDDYPHMLAPDKVCEILGGDLSRKELYELPIPKIKLSAKRVLYAPSDVKAYLMNKRGEASEYATFLFSHFLQRPPLSARVAAREFHGRPEKLLEELPELGPFPWDAKALFGHLSAARKVRD